MSIELVVAILACALIAGAILTGARNSEHQAEIAFLEAQLAKAGEELEKLKTLRREDEERRLRQYNETHERCHEREVDLQKQLASVRHERNSLERRLESAAKGERLLQAIQILRGVEEEKS